MNRNNLILIAIIAIIAVALGLFVFMQPHTADNSKIHTEIDFLSESTLKNGEAIEFALRDDQNHALANQSVNIIFTENGENQTYSIFTDDEGKGALVLNNEAAGDYDVYVTYNGTNRYEACSAKTTVTVEEGVSQVNTDVSYNQSVPDNSSAGTALYNANSSSNSQLHYDAQYNFYYDDDGIIRGGQSDGYSAEYIRDSYESGDMIDEEGNLQ